MSSAASSNTATPQTSTSTPPSAPQPAPGPPSFRYFRPPTSAHQPRTDLPDNYFDVTAADLRAQQASLAARRDALQNAPLRTAAMRDAEDKKRRARWPQTTIRVKFSDRSVLERTFPSTDKIKSVYAFVRSSLREDVKPIKFVLYQSPPKRELRVSDPKVRDLSLVELDLAPSSILLLKFLDDESLNHTDIPAPLAPSVIALAEDFPVPPSFDAEPKKEDKGKSIGGSRLHMNLDFGKKKDGDDGGERKFPKWLKLGPK
ncbi:hypothetical protein BC628DRAFT_1345173 [Trametes gibbosa]|nr:hypothetical protein BC628DRAFT_1345173 [Trametes gibbosa]